MTGDASGDVEQSNPAPRAGIKIHKQMYTPAEFKRRILKELSRRKLMKLSLDDIYGILEDLQHDLRNPTSNEGGGLDANISKVLTLPNIDDMPLSPLMDPKLVGARRRHLNAKQFPRKNLTHFETLLAKNSYGISQSLLSHISA